MKREYLEIIEKTAEELNGGKGRAFIGFKEKVINLTDDLLAAMFPRHLAGTAEYCAPLSHGIPGLTNVFHEAEAAFEFVMDEGAEDAAATLIASLPEIREIMETDIQAAYEGDPAAKDTNEVILAYPAFIAIGTHRLAHKILEIGVPLVPRMMSEYAHRRTGIDIHPGATIGRYFFIDHGTGVVIGETTRIGDHVKLYQNVTLGARSFDVAPDGSLVKGIKRHPDLGNGVVVYAGASILGGDTVIGDGAVIGGNVWLTHSVAPGDVLLAEPAAIHHKLK